MKTNFDDISDRFQYQPWYVKLWRYRYYIPIPFYATKMWLFSKWDCFSFGNAWSIAVGLAQVKMNWLYSWEEAKTRLHSLMDDRED